MLSAINYGPAWIKEKHHERADNTKLLRCKAPAMSDVGEDPINEKRAIHMSLFWTETIMVSYILRNRGYSVWRLLVFKGF